MTLESRISCRELAVRSPHLGQSNEKKQSASKLTSFKNYGSVTSHSERCVVCLPSNSTINLKEKTKELPTLRLCIDKDDGRCARKQMLCRYPESKGCRDLPLCSPSSNASSLNRTKIGTKSLTHGPLEIYLRFKLQHTKMQSLFKQKVRYNSLGSVREN